MAAAAKPDAGEDALRIYRQHFDSAPKRVALYSPLPSEFDPQALAYWFADQGAVIALPVIVAEGLPLAFRRFGDLLDLNTLFGVHEPMPHEPLILDLDVIFVPLLGFDRTGARLGRGKGFYDRTLGAERQRPSPPLAIGLAFSEQCIDHIPTGRFDQRLDGVLTETAYLDFTGGHPIHAP